MLELTQLNGETIYVNPNLIETMESTPDTVLKLTTGKMLMVRESTEIVARRFAEFAARVAHPAVEASEEITWT